MDHVDICIIGAGVVGLAIAQKLASSSNHVVILEQHASFGQETSSRNSEVIHAGIYYSTGSLKAQLCVAGKRALYDYCERHQVPHRRVEKLIVATTPKEEAVLHDLLQKAIANGVEDLTWWSSKKLQAEESEVSAALALHSPSTGIVDSHALMRSFLGKAESQGASLAAKTKLVQVEVLSEGFRVHDQSDEEHTIFHTSILINSAGLQAQRMASQIDRLDPQVIPPLYLCKGNYFTLQGKSPFSRLIYPIPEAGGLGVHATLDLAGQTRFGPDFEYIEQEDYQVSLQNLPQYYQTIRRYYPGLKEDSLLPGYVGIRPKLQAPGDPFHDFVIQDEQVHQIPGLIQLFGIESPGLTSALAIADYVANLL